MGNDTSSAEAWTCVSDAHSTPTTDQTPACSTLALPRVVATGTATYYIERHHDFVTRHPTLTPPAYYLKFGNDFYVRFQALKPSLTPSGRAWVEDTARILQEKMEARVGSTNRERLEFDALERDSDAFQEFAYGTHCDAYIEGGLAFLPLEDILKIVQEIGAEMADLSVIQQAGCVFLRAAPQQVYDIIIPPAY